MVGRDKTAAIADNPYQSEYSEVSDVLARPTLQNIPTDEKTTPNSMMKRGGWCLGVGGGSCRVGRLFKRLGE